MIGGFDMNFGDVSISTDSGRTFTPVAIDHHNSQFVALNCRCVADRLVQGTFNTKRKRNMKDKYRITVKFRNQYADHGYTYKSWVKADPASYVVVDSPVSGMTVATVIKCEKAPKGDWETSPSMKWIVDVVSTKTHRQAVDADDLVKALEQLDELQLQIKALRSNLKRR